MAAKRKYVARTVPSRRTSTGKILKGDSVAGRSRATGRTIVGIHGGVRGANVILGTRASGFAGTERITKKSMRRATPVEGRMLNSGIMGSPVLRRATAGAKRRRYSVSKAGVLPIVRSSMARGTHGQVGRISGNRGFNAKHPRDARGRFRRV